MGLGRSLLETHVRAPSCHALELGFLRPRGCCLAGFSSWDVEEFACLHKQITEWVLCCHYPKHQDLADAVIQVLGPSSTALRRVVRSATAGRRAITIPSAFGR